MLPSRAGCGGGATFWRQSDLQAAPFPSISTGSYGYPVDLAAPLSVEALMTARTEVEQVLLVAYSGAVAEHWGQALGER